MATITTINNGDSGLNTRNNINTNFANLNSDKLETSLKGAPNGLAELDGSGNLLNNLTTRTFWGQNFNGSANVDGNLSSVNSSITLFGTTPNITIGGSIVAGNHSFNLFQNALAGAATKNINIGGNGTSGSATTINLGTNNASSSTVNVNIATGSTSSQPSNINIGSNVGTTNIISSNFNVGANLYVNGGNVGVKKSSPTSPLYVYENTADTGATAGVNIEQNGTGDAVLHYSLSGAQTWSMGIDNSDEDTFKIAPSPQVDTNSTLVMSTVGNLGLGLKPPTNVRFQIYDASTDQSISALRLLKSTSGYGSGNNGARLDFYTRFTANNFFYFQGRIRGIDDGIGGAGSGAGGLAFDVYNSAVITEAMRLSSNGNVGIGTTTTTVGSRLQVAGGDIRLTDASKGLICRTPDNTKSYRISVDNAGSVITTLV